MGQQGSAGMVKGEGEGDYRVGCKAAYCSSMDLHNNIKMKLNLKRFQQTFQHISPTNTHTPTYTHTQTPLYMDVDFHRFVDV